MELVSIILPFRNAARWMEETIHSIQQQRYVHWELIAVDDHSEDESAALLMAMAENDSRIRVIPNAGTGIIPALRLALQHTSGSYITRMDADDRMPPQRLQKMVDCLQQAPSRTVVTGKVQYFSNETVSEGYKKYESWLNDRIDQQDHYRHIYRECIVASPNWMMRRSEALESRLFEQLSYPEDYDLCFHWMTQGFRIEVVPEVTLWWREHPQRTSRNSAVYDQESFFRLKLTWFARLHSELKSVGIVGCGQKGKLCLSLLNETGMSCSLYDLHPERYPNGLYGVPVQAADQLTDPVLLIARYPTNTTALQAFIEAKGYIFGETAFWV